VIVDLVHDARAELGEGPIWDDARGRLLFTDIMRGAVHAFDPGTGDDRVLHVPEPVGAIALTVSGDYLLAAQTGFIRIDPADGAIRRVAGVEADVRENRMNDGAVDARGRFWAGTMDMCDRPGRGALYRCDPDGRVTRVLSAVGISNGIDWSPDGRLMYYVDTLTGRVDVFDFDDASGAIANRRPFAVIPEEAGAPDGLIVDVEGGVWVALWGGGAIRRYRADGVLDAVVPLPVTHPTKCGFGGPDFADLYVTTAWIALDAAERRAQPHAGGLFRLRPGVRGRRPHRYGS
jgi:sugar lactone lactonase YvrE